MITVVVHSCCSRRERERAGFQIGLTMMRRHTSLWSRLRIRTAGHFIDDGLSDHWAHLLFPIPPHLSFTYVDVTRQYFGLSSHQGNGNCRGSDVLTSGTEFKPLTKKKKVKCNQDKCHYSECFLKVHDEQNIKILNKDQITTLISLLP